MRSTFQTTRERFRDAVAPGLPTKTFPEAVIAIVVFLLVCNICLAEPILLTDKSTTVTYPHNTVVEAPVAFAYIAEDILLVKDMDGRFYVPGKNFHNLPYLRVGCKYQVVITRPTELIWNFDPGYVKVPSLYHEHTNPKYYEPVEPTRSDMSILVTDIPREGEIGVFTESGICVGAAAFSNQNRVGITVWGDNPLTSQIDGALTGEPFLLFYSDNTGPQYDIGYEIIQGEDTFAADSFLLTRWHGAKSKFSQYIILSGSSPTPFASTIDFSYFKINLEEDCFFYFALFDTSGKKIEEIESGQNSAGTHSFKFGNSTIYSLTNPLYVHKIKIGRNVSKQVYICNRAINIR